MATFSLEERAINNAKVQIIRFYRNGILVRILSNNKQIIVTRKSYSIDVQSKRRNVISFTLLRRQFPLRLCYAMTFNKCQGQTLHRISIGLRFPVFTHGQLYVCASRASSAVGLRFWLGDEVCKKDALQVWWIGSNPESVETAITA